MYGCESWTVKKAERQRIDAFELWCWRRLLRVPWTTRRYYQPILKEISPEYSLERLMLNLKLQYFGYLMWRAHLRRPWCWERSKAGGEGTTEDEVIGCHHWLDGHEFERALRVGKGQGGLACCSPWGHKELDTTEWLNWTEDFHWYFFCTLKLPACLNCSHCHFHRGLKLCSFFSFFSVSAWVVITDRSQFLQIFFFLLLNVFLIPSKEFLISDTWFFYL